VLGSRRDVRERKKPGRRKILSPQQADMLQRIWTTMGYPSGKRMHPMLAEWVEGWEKLHRPLSEPFPDLSETTLDRELSAFKIRKTTKREDLIRLTHLKKNIPYVDRSKQPAQPGHLSSDTRSPLQRRHVGRFRKDFDGNGRIDGLDTKQRDMEQGVLQGLRSNALAPEQEE